MSTALAGKCFHDVDCLIHVVLCEDERAGDVCIAMSSLGANMRIDETVERWTCILAYEELYALAVAVSSMVTGLSTGTPVG